MSEGRKAVLIPLVLAWLAVHAAVLAIFLAAKFLGLKALGLALMLAAAFWFLTGRKRPLSLPRPASVV